MLYKVLSERYLIYTEDYISCWIVKATLDENDKLDANSSFTNLVITTATLRCIKDRYIDSKFLIAVYNKVNKTIAKCNATDTEFQHIKNLLVYKNVL